MLQLPSSLDSYRPKWRWAPRKEKRKKEKKEKKKEKKEEKEKREEGIEAAIDKSDPHLGTYLPGNEIG